MEGADAPTPRVGKNRGTDSRHDPSRRVDGSAFANPEFHPTKTLSADSVYSQYSGIGPADYGAKLK